MAPVSFCDVAGSFSKEEWKLLHDWQTELYEMVMKEIHQAITALGPLISTVVFSLRSPEKDLFSMDQVSERRSRRTHPPQFPFCNSDILLTEQGFESSTVRNPVAELKERSSSPTSAIGPAVASTVASFSGDEGEEDYCMDRHDSERSFCTSGFTEERAVNTPVVPFKIKEEATSSLFDYADSQILNINGHIEHEDMTHIYSFIIKEDELRNSMDHQDSEAIEHSATIAGSQHLPTEETIPAAPVECIQLRHPSSMYLGPFKDSVLAKLVVVQHERDACTNTKRNACYSGENAVTTTDCRGLHGRAMVKVLENTEPGASYRRQLEPGSSQFERFSMREECSRAFSMQSSSKIRLWNKNSTCQPNAPIGFKPFACSECVKCFKTKAQLTRHQRTHSGERPYHCAICGNSFSLSHHLLRHQRTHTGERPFQCNQCKKRFAFKEVLKRHQRTHLVMCKKTKLKKGFSLRDPH